MFKDKDTKIKKVNPPLIQIKTLQDLLIYNKNKAIEYINKLNRYEFIDYIDNTVENKT